MDTTTEPLWQRAAEFGVTAFLLVVILCGAGWALWKIGNRIVDVLTISLTRQAEMTERTANAVEQMCDLTSAVHRTAESNGKSIETVGRELRHAKTAIRHIVAAIHELSPTDPPRVRSYLDEARRILESD